jgi:hypothetical protein
LVSATTPITVHIVESDGPSLMRRPIGGPWPGHSRSASARSMTTTRGAPARSRTSKTRPARSGSPSAWKYDGVTEVSIAVGASAAE